jgi:hypothetical protein
MPIVFAGETGIRKSSFGSFLDQITKDFSQAASNLMESATSLIGGTPKRQQIEPVYVDDGFNNVPGFSYANSTTSNIRDIKTRQIITQEPQATVYIKKRAFWSFRNEYDARFMDSGEKLFIRATKAMFERKCNQMAAYEGITKASKLLSEDADLDAARLEQIAEQLTQIGAAIVTDAFNEAAPFMANGSIPQEELDALAQLADSLGEVAPIIADLKKIINNQKKLASSTYTNWVIDNDLADIMNVGRGAGVIELTSVTDLSTSLRLDASLGSITFAMEDPYNLSKITEDDIELAIGVAHRNEGNYPIKGSLSKLLQDAKDKDALLRTARNNRLNLGILSSFFGNQSAGNFLATSNEADITFEINGSSTAPYPVVGYVSSYAEPSKKTGLWNQYLVYWTSTQIRLIKLTSLR